MLYRLAFQLAKKGSKTAMELLMKLPSVHAAFEGWLFEYEFDNFLWEELLKCRRWTFKEARNIENPSTEEEKRESLKKLVAAY